MKFIQKQIDGGTFARHAEGERILPIRVICSRGMGEGFGKRECRRLASVLGSGVGVKDQNVISGL